MLSNRIIWLLLLYPRITDSRVTVNQTPVSINVTKGDTLNLHCNFSVDTTHSKSKLIGSYMWYKDYKTSEVCNNCAEYFGRVLHTDASSFLELKIASISITETKLNDTGTYYCEVHVIRGGSGTGEGIRVTVNAHIDSEETQSPIQWNTNLLIFSVVVLVLFAIILIKIISTLHSSRPPDNGTGDQVANEDEDLSNATIYTKLNISRSNIHRHPDQAVSETKWLSAQTENPAKRGSAPIPKSNEVSIVYSASPQQGQSEAGVRFSTPPTAGTKGEQIVYAAVCL